MKFPNRLISAPRSLRAPRAGADYPLVHKALKSRCERVTFHTQIYILFEGGLNSIFAIVRLRSSKIDSIRHGKNKHERVSF